MEALTYAGISFAVIRGKRNGGALDGLTLFGKRNHSLSIFELIHHDPLIQRRVVEVLITKMQHFPELG